MRADGSPAVKDVVLVGAGHAHVQVLRRFAMRPLPGVRLTLISRELHTPYSGMLPGLIAGHYRFDDAHIDTAPLARFAGARLYGDEVTGLDLARRLVLCRQRPPVPYDILSLDIGSRPNTGAVPGAAEHAIPVKPIDGFLARFEALRARVLAGRSRRVLVVGGGAGGVELLLALEHRLRRDLAATGDDAALGCTLVAGATGLLPAFPRAFRDRFVAVLERRGIALHEGARVAAVEPGAVMLDDGRGRIPADEILWTTEASPAGWLAGTGLALDAQGFVRVDATLRAAGRDDVFAAGDTIAFDPHPLPRSGVYAVRAGPVLADNIRAALTGQRLRPYRPQRDALYIVSTGAKHAIATRNGLTVAGDWVWRWKDWIDRRFMRRFIALPAMPAPPADAPRADAMRCGGCGAKLGATTLARVLGGLAPAPNPDVLVGLDAPDDAAVVETGGPLLAVHTVDHFRAMIDDPWRFGMIAANHALGDIHAMGAKPHTALAIATVPFGDEAKVEADLAAMLAGANAMLRASGCALVGGHTGEGAELALGFAVEGRVSRDALMRKGGLVPGDVLVLTKAIGTGVVLAGHMRGLARARWLEATLVAMCVPSGPAAAILAAHGARGMTDVTGFGLIGHLVEMTRASGVGAELVLDRIPVLPGARELAARGVASSLLPQNLRLREAIRDPADAEALPMFPLLFDPQTAGGLLAGVPAERADACVTALCAAGYAEAAVIGTVRPRADGAPPITLRASADAA
ncbi:selenide, water dikinase SelD [Elioraea tepidiphila]|uniref:selenide, water dikinase SelD n=1 Tax=Elioraea tepidiphila TaxID=457934 RepID=UPI0004777C52|nr:selenide, water dikinase SelD [Elioraea tepidiphila]